MLNALQQKLGNGSLQSEVFRTLSGDCRQPDTYKSPLYREAIYNLPPLDQTSFTPETINHANKHIHSRLFFFFFCFIIYCVRPNYVDHGKLHKTRFPATTVPPKVPPSRCGFLALLSALRNRRSNKRTKES